MNMQVYLQIAEINTKMKAVRSLLARVESQQASIQHLLQKDTSRNRISAHLVPTSPDKTGDEYVEALMRVGPIY